MPAGNTLATATALNLTTPLQVTGDAVTAAAPDFYSFRLSGRSSLNFSLTALTSAPNGNVNFEVLAANGTTIVQRSANGGSLSESINLLDQAPGTYYLRVYTDSASNANYTLNLATATTLRSDLVWRNYGTGTDSGKTLIWTMNGTTAQQSQLIAPSVPDRTWQIVGTGDFNQDGQTDLVWRNYGTGSDSGKTLIWTMNGTTAVQSLLIAPAVPDTTWQIEATRLRYDVPPRLDLAGNTAGTAFNLGGLNANGVYRDRIDSTDTTDFYRFTVSSDRTISLVIDGLTADVTVQLFRDANNNGTIEPGEAVPFTLQSASDYKLGNPSLVAGTYFLQLSTVNASAGTNYTLTLDGNANYTSQVLAPMPAALNEASGFVKGAGDFWWTIEDSGNTATLYALNRAGQVIGQVTVNGATNVDWEEITAGPNPYGSGRVLFIGDFGNNTFANPPLVGSRTNQAIYVVSEPSLNATSVGFLQKLEVDFPPGENYDIEAMVYDAQARQLVLITKDLNGVATGTGGVSKIFTRSIDPAQSLVTQVATFDLSSRPLTNTPLGPYGLDRLITGAALSDDGRVFVLRTYKTVFRWVRAPGESWATVLANDPQEIALANEPQGEAIAFWNGNDEFYTISEAVSQPGQPAPQIIRYFST